MPPPRSSPRPRAAASRTRAPAGRGRRRRRRRAGPPPSRRSSRGQRVTRRLATGERLGRGSAVEVHRDQDVGRVELGLPIGRAAGPAPPRRGRGCGPTARPAAAGRRARRRSHRGAWPRTAGRPPVAMPTIGRPSPCARPFAVAMPDPQPGERARPGADDDRGDPRPVDPVVGEQPLERRQERLAVAVAGRPARHRHHLARRACRSRGRSAWWRCRWRATTSPAVAALTGRPPGSAGGARRGRSARSRAGRRRSPR